MAEDFYNIEVAIGVLWSCCIVSVGKIILNGELETWGKPQRISVAGDTKQHRNTTYFPGTRSCEDHITGSLLQNSKAKERKHALLLFINFLRYLTALFQM
jgi:hypothetical protein